MFQWIGNKSRIFLALFASITIVVVKTTEAFNVCGPTTNDETSSSLVFVSTLDGKLTALDLGENGKAKWSLDFDEEPMLSSGTHGREFNNDGSWIRMIPSLNGGLYVFDGNNVKAVPITTDQLLKSSFRYSEDVVFSGGKETRSYGVSSTTGKIIYQCNINGCSNNTDDDSHMELDDVLVVQRFQQTVRAVEPRTGHEKWNFSVGQYQIELIPRESHDCNSKLTNIANDIELRVVVPDGIVWAINKTNANVKLWQHKFDSPIVSIWREGTSNDNDNSSKLKSVNLFDSTNWSKTSNFIESPSIYVGMHDRQLYIQENTDKMNELNIKKSKPTTFPWQPYQATDTAIAVVENSPKTTALSILYNTEYVNGNGFYLHTKEHHEESHQCNKTEENIIIPHVETTTTTTTSNYDNSSNENDNDNEETPVQIIIVSLWYWWKEVIIISITSAVLLNFMLPQKLLNATTPAKDGLLPPLVVERHFETKEKDRKLSFNNQDNNADFKSRYLTDFEPIDCLGKGGYGVVFEAKNKIDDCMYAIKRIALPNSQDSRDRVMREVKALAKLDHHNIVRYFNAWLECPPVGWQETHDSKFIDKMRFSPSDLPSETSMSTKPNDHHVCIDVSSSNRSSVDSALEAVKLNKTNDDDSYIVFESSESDKSSVVIEDEQDNIDNSDSIVFQNSTSSENNNLNTTKSINNNDTIDESQSIIFDNSISNSNVNEKNRKKASFSLDLNNINNTNTKNNTKTTNNNKQNNKKTPKMLLYIQMQLCQRKSLRDWLKNQPTPRDSGKIIIIFQQIVNAVEYVHLQGLIHRDLKPSNIFFALDDKIKIGDFGLVTAMTEGYDDVRTPNDDTYEINEKTGIHTACVGTHLYMSPEQSEGQSYNYKVDIYSLGIILFELLNAFSTEMERVTALLNLRKTIFPNGFEDNHPNEYKLLKMMLDINPSKRPTTYGIKAQPPLNRTETDGLSDDGDKWHFDLPQISRHSSTTGSSSSSTGE